MTNIRTCMIAGMFSLMLPSISNAQSDDEPGLLSVTCKGLASERQIEKIIYFPRIPHVSQTKSDTLSLFSYSPKTNMLEYTRNAAVFLDTSGHYLIQGVPVTFVKVSPKNKSLENSIKGLMELGASICTPDCKNPIHRPRIIDIERVVINRDKDIQTVDRVIAAAKFNL